MSDTQFEHLAVPRFARHETFAPRFGWLHKAYTAVLEDQEVFLRKDAPVTLGVGKNMVNAIRYWSSAFKLTIELPKGGGSRANVAAPTWRAKWLLGEYGADPYLEDPASLWLLHWWLLSPQQGARCEAPTWWVAFHTLSAPRFDEARLADLVEQQISLTGWSTPAPGSIRKDVDCLTKMYAPRSAVPRSQGSFEDLLDCPFRELGLLESTATTITGGSRTWRFTATPRTSLPARVTAYACLDYAARNAGESGSISLARLANEPGAPGRAFCIREPELAAALTEVAGEHDGIRLTDAVGQRSLVFREESQALGWDILDGYYKTVSSMRWKKVARDWAGQHSDASASLRQGSRAGTELPLIKEPA